LIEQAEIALIEKSKQSGKVLQQQDHHLKEDEGTYTLVQSSNHSCFS
jgi:hypothetical protein